MDGSGLSSSGDPPARTTGGPASTCDELLSTRAQQGRHPEKGPLSPIPNVWNGWLEGVRLAQQPKRQKKMSPYRKFLVKIVAIVWATFSAVLLYTSHARGDAPRARMLAAPPSPYFPRARGRPAMHDWEKLCEAILPTRAGTPLSPMSPLTLLLSVRRSSPVSSAPI